MKWVKYEKDKQRIPVKSWCENIEDGAMEQAINLTNLPFAFHHIAIMPDCHQVIDFWHNMYYIHSKTNKEVLL